MKKNKKRTGIFDFLIAVHKEMIPGGGEDVLLCMPEYGITAVFDGCGGLGSRRYPSENGKTGAYLAASMAAGILRDCAKEGASGVERYEAKLKTALAEYNTELNQKNGFLQMRSDMVRSLPATAAIAVTDSEAGICECLWAGDSRIYLLDQNGLRCLNCNDCGDERRLDNYINADIPFTFEKRWADIHAPCGVLTATDGAYSYFRTPMEFEYMLLETLSASVSPENWEELLDHGIGAYAGDDYTLTAAFIGCTFENAKKIFAPRLEVLYSEYIRPLAEDGSVAVIARLCERYRPGYLGTADGAD